LDTKDEEIKMQISAFVLKEIHTFHISTF